MTAAGAAPVRFGITGPGAGDVVADARRAEELGFDYFGLGEHLFFHVPTVNSFVALGGAAAVTTRIQLITSIALLPLYPAALAAKLATTVDQLSGGRFHLGVGVGGEYPREFEASGVPVTERGRRTDEALEVLLRLWTERDVTFEGRFTRLSGVTLDPPPVRRPHPPVWISGRSDAAHRRASRFGDGWMPYMFSPEMCRRSIDRVRSGADGLGRDAGAVESGVVVFTVCHDDEATARRLASEHLARTYVQDFGSMLDRYCVVGTPEQCRQRVEEYLDAGVETVLFVSGCEESHRLDNVGIIAEQVVAPLAGGIEPPPRPPPGAAVGHATVVL